MAGDERAALLGPPLVYVLDKLPKRLQPMAKQALHKILNAESREHAEQGIHRLAQEYWAKHLKAIASLRKDHDKLLTLLDLPNTGSESAIATMRLRQRAAMGARSRLKALMIAYKLLDTAQLTCVDSTHLTCCIWW